MAGTDKAIMDISRLDNSKIKRDKLSFLFATHHLDKTNTENIKTVPNSVKASKGSQLSQSIKAKLDSIIIFIMKELFLKCRISMFFSPFLY